MFQFKQRTFKIPCNIGEITIFKKNFHKTPFGTLKGEGLEEAQSLYLLF